MHHRQAPERLHGYRGAAVPGIHAALLQPRGVHGGGGRRALRSLRVLALLVCGLATAAPHARADVAAALDVGAPAVLDKGEVQRDGRKDPATLRLEAGGSARFDLELKAAPEAKGVEPEGWYLWLSLDVTSFDEGSAVDARIEFEDGRVRPWRWSKTPGTAAVIAGGTSRRLARALPVEGADAATPGKLTLTLTARGGAVAVDAAQVLRFHRAPTPKLIGKANGKLGPDRIGCGMLGFTALTEHMHGAFTVLEVRPGGPAEVAGLEVGDLVVAVGEAALPRSSIAPGWDWFERSHEAMLGRAIEAALEGGVRHVDLRVDRGRRPPKRRRVTLPLKGAELEGFPLTGDSAEDLREDLIAWAVSHQKPNGGWPGTDAVNPALGALALLGTGDRTHAPAIRRAVEFLLKKNPKPSEMRGLAYWTIAFQGILFCELHLQKEDPALLGWIEEAARWLPTTTHESKWGMQAFGHGPDGLPYDDKALMAPTAHLLVFDALARRCGVESRIWEHVEAYVRHSWADPKAESGKTHGAMGYNGSYKDRGEFWSRTGLVALAEVLRGDRAGLAPYLTLLMKERHPWMLNSHAYGEPGAALGLLSLGVVEPDALAEILPRWRWRFLCAWEPGYGLRYSTPHMGAPYMGQESVVNLGYLLLLSLVNEGLVIAGR